jgi:hypothetical protein
LLRFFYEIHKSISKTEKWELPDEIYKKLDECRNCGSRHVVNNPKPPKLLWIGYSKIPFVLHEFHNYTFTFINLLL